MLKIAKNVAAENDLIDIWIYSFENWGMNQADKYLDQLNDGFRIIATKPFIGSHCDDIRKGYFSFPIKQHIVFYQIKTQTLQIIRVLGGEMDHGSYLKL